MSLTQWVAISPDGGILLPTSPAASRLTGKRAAIMEAREHYTLDIQIREQTDYIDYLPWSEVREAGYLIRLATITARRFTNRTAQP